MKVSLTRSANAELTEGTSFYRSSGDAILGHEFTLEFERSIGLLRLHPQIGAVWRGSIRQFALRRFPYTILYEVREAELVVIAVAHQRRRPASWLTSS